VVKEKFCFQLSSKRNSCKRFIDLF